MGIAMEGSAGCAVADSERRSDPGMMAIWGFP